MPYEPMSFELFRQRVMAGRYKTLQAVRRAVTLTTWDDETKASATLFVDQFFASLGQAPLEAHPAGEAHGGITAAIRNLENLVAAAEIAPRVRRSLEAAVAAVRDAARGAPAPPPLPAQAAGRKASKPGPAKVPAAPPPAPEQPPKHDLSKLMEGAIDDPGEDDEEEDDGHRNGTSTDIGADEVARMMTLRPDYEEKIAQMEANATTEKEKAAARTLGKLVRQQVAKGAFSKK